MTDEEKEAVLREKVKDSDAREFVSKQKWPHWRKVKWEEFLDIFAKCYNVRFHCGFLKHCIGERLRDGFLFLS